MFKLPHSAILGLAHPNHKSTVLSLNGKFAEDIFKTVTTLLTCISRMHARSNCMEDQVNTYPAKETCVSAQHRLCFVLK